MSFLRDDRPVAITGATGQLGTAFASLVPSALLVTRSDLDLNRPDDVASEIERIDPSAVVNCAAYTNVDGAETNEAEATRVNGDSVGELAAATQRLGIPFVTFSTDYVFGGGGDRPYVESDAVAPLNAYGRSKLVGEQLAARNNPDSLIIRTSWMVSRTHDNFVSTMLKLASGESSKVKVVDDQRGCPTIADDLAEATLAALAARATGVLHLANGPAATWFDVASFSVKHAGLGGAVEPCTTAEFPRPARRPINSVLESERLQDLTSIDMPAWQTSMVNVVDAQMKRISSSA